VPVNYNRDWTARNDVEKNIRELPWEKTLDFCERLFSHLAQEVSHFDFNNEPVLDASRDYVQLWIAGELERLFTEEGLAFEFHKGLVQRRGRRHTAERVSKAQVVLGDPRLDSARRHYDKALKFFREPSNPDYENAVKEAVCAVEAAGKVLFPEAKATTLGDLAKWLVDGNGGKLPKALGQTFTGVYGFRSGGDGVSHGASKGGAATMEIAEYVLALAASQVILLVDVAASQEEDIPF